MIDNPVGIGGSAVLSTLIIQWIKNSGWATWFTRETARANLALSIFAAGLATAGVHFTFDATSDTIAIIGVAAFFQHGIWQWFVQWVAQHAAYKGLVVGPEILGEIRTLLARMADGGPVSEGDAKVMKGEADESRAAISVDHGNRHP